MDRVQPIDVNVIAPIEAFGADPATSKVKNDLVVEIELDVFEPEAKEQKLELEAIADTCDNNVSEVQASPPPPLNLPKIIVTKESELSPTESNYQPFPEFDELMNISRFIMSYTGRYNAKVFTQDGVVHFKCTYPPGGYWEGCHPDAIVKVVEILEFRTSKLIMQLRLQTLPCHSCFEEETNSVDLLGPDERLLATIIQKKTWTNTKIHRDITIQPGPYGKSDTYTAQFTWNDASINFKTHRSGMVVATLMTDCQEAPCTSDYVLQFLRDIRPRDKAILIGFMIARDILMTDESQTRTAVERATLFLVVIVFILIFLYVFLPSREGNASF